MKRKQPTIDFLYLRWLRRKRSENRFPHTSESYFAGYRAGLRAAKRKGRGK